MKVFDLLLADIVKIIYTQYTNKDNKQKIDKVSSDIFGIFIDKIKPYFLILTALLVVLIILNVVQFYYFMRTFLKQVDIKDQANVVREIMQVA